MIKGGGRRDLQHLAHIASTENLVNNGKLMGIIRREERREDAILGAAPSEKFAGSTRRIPSHDAKLNCYMYEELREKY